jgi:iron complex outermembrane receptor protein
MFFMDNRRRSGLSIRLACLLSGALSLVFGQGSLAEDYSDVETVEVVGEGFNQASVVGSSRMREFSSAALTRPTNLVEALRGAPSLSLTTNSRGETLASFRGSGERQFLVSLDGAPLNVPWDNRLDLGLVPQFGVAGYRLFLGPTPSGWGANTAGGVLELIPNSDAGGEISLQAGNEGRRIAAGRFAARSGAVRFLLAGGHDERDGLAVPEKNSEDFSANSDGKITNTAKQQTNVYARVALDLKQGSSIAASVLYGSSNQGVAPEQGQFFNDSDARFWRYPDIKNLLATLSGQFVLSDYATLKTTVWRRDFDQTIADFTDRDYSLVDSYQQDRNTVYGAKAAVSFEAGENKTTVSALFESAEHLQASTSEGNADEADFEHFTNTALNLAVDSEQSLSETVTVQAGFGFARFQPRKTAGRDSAGSFSGLNMSAGLNWRMNDDVSLRASAGRRVRMPTMRELFGEAIGRFLLNPTLKPEATWQFEIGGRWANEIASIDVVPFISMTKDTLDQTRVDVDGVLLRQRINLRGSQSYGVEIVGQVIPLDKLNLSGNVTWAKHQPKRETVDNTVRRLYLSDRPNWLARLEAKYQLGEYTTFGLLVVHRGEAQSIDANGFFQKTNVATTFNIELNHQIMMVQDGIGAAVFMRADNLTDAFVEPQLGLPEGGRSILTGIEVQF